MESNVEKLPSSHKNEKEKGSSSSEEVSSKNKIKEKDVNSWDRSTSSHNEVVKKSKTNDWDSSSDCQATMVEPFNSNAKECGNWDSDSDKGIRKGSGVNLKETENILGSFESFDLSEFSDLEASSVSELMSKINSHRPKNLPLGKNSVKSDDFLYVEDLEEFSMDNGFSKPRTLNEKQNQVKNDIKKEEEQVRSIQSEGTPEDTTIWMIPNSERTQSAESDTRLIFNHDRAELENVDEFNVKICKSYSGVELSKGKRKVDRSCRSDSVYIDSKKNNISKFLSKCEGLGPHKNLETKVKDGKEGISGCGNFDKSSGYFAEYECRAITTNYNAPDKAFSDTSRSIVNSNEEIFSDANSNVVEENNVNSNSSNSNNDDIVRTYNGTRHSEATLTNLVRTGPATTPLDVLSLPDMTGKNSIKERQGKEKLIRRRIPPAKTRNEDTESTEEPSSSTKNPTESWFLLDETGQYQQVTRNEVTILLNGRSADDVLQEKKEHFIPHTNFIDSRSPSVSLSNIITKESLQCILRKDDKGGEGTSKRLIDLERKMENTLLYIQPSPNLTASIRLIPVDTEMIHIWRRRAKDNGSLLSSDIDLRLRPSQDSFETSNQRNVSESIPTISSLTKTENSDMPLPQQVESAILDNPTEVLHPVNLIEDFGQQNQINGYSDLLIETRAVVDNLTNNFKILQSRLDGETSRSLALQGEVSKLRNIIKAIGKQTLDENLLQELVSDHRLYDSLSASLSTLIPTEKISSMGIKNEDEITLTRKSTTVILSEVIRQTSTTEDTVLNAHKKVKEMETESEAETETETETEPEPEKETEREEEEEAMEKAVKKVVENALENALENAMGKSVEETVEEVVEDAVEKSVEEVVEETVEEAVEDAVEKSVEEVVEETVEEAVEEAVVEAVEEAVEEVVEEATEDAMYVAVEEAMNETVEEAVKEAVEVAMEEAVEEVMEEIVEESMEEAMDEVMEEKEKDSENEDDTEDLGSNCITVNVYTLEACAAGCDVDRVEKTNSLLQTNLGIIEGKMKTLQEENEIITKQNIELKRKLEEISHELEKYLASTSGVELSFEDEKEMDALRDQVCNLKLELDNLKREKRMHETELKAENSLIKNELEHKSLSLEECSSAIVETFRELENSKSKLEEIGIIPDLNLNLETFSEPKFYLKAFISFIKQTTESLFKMYNENLVNQEVLKEVTRDNFIKRETAPNIIDGLDKVISGYTELIVQCKKSSGDGNNKVMDDYFTVIMEKASLMEEIKILKTENEILMESQLEHYEKLKQTMIALKDKKNEITVLESTQKLSEEERSKMISLLEVSEVEKKYLKDEVENKTIIIEDLMNEKKQKDLELSDYVEKFNEVAKEIKNLDESCRLKDDLINELKMENDRIVNAEEMINNQVEISKEEIKNLKTENKQLEAELEALKLFLNDSQKEMTEYITHLETVINNGQESLDKTKQKLKESNQALIRLKNENDVLDQQHQCDVKLYNKTKEELDDLKGKLASMEEKFREVDEEKEKLHANFEKVSNLEKEKSQELDAVTKERKILLMENSSLKEKVEMFSRDKDESLKDQKDLINKYAILSKEVQKFQDKYRNVKSECNKRTDIIKYLEMMLRENLMEYNNRILCLEKNISHIIEKIAACKNCMREKHAGVDSEVRELRHQLEVTYQERRELENVVSDYYSVLKRMENEIQEKEKKMDEMHVKLSQEQQKAINYENNSPLKNVQNVLDNSSEILKIKKLESQILIAQNELAECKKQLHQRETNQENEKKKLELIIADLKSEINRYQIRNEVMMKNLSSCNKTLNGLTTDKRNAEGAIQNVQAMTKEIDEKSKKIIDLNEIISSFKVEIKMKESDLENIKTKSICLTDEVKNLKDQLSKLQDTLSASNKNFEVQQKEKNEMAEKLLQSIRLIMEEKSARQTLEALTAEKEKNFKEQIDHIKNELASKIKENEALSGALEDKKKYSNKLQDDLKKMKSELIALRKRNLFYLDSESHKHCIRCSELPLNSSSSLTQIKPQNITAERLESCLRELKEVRDMNLQLRKTEGQYEAKIVCLEDEIRDARLLIKELQGDLKTEKKSKKALKSMIASAKMEMERCVAAKQLTSIVAERIKRHLDLSEVSSRELLSCFRSNESIKSPQVVD